ncbi:MAG: hypothetical protein QOJ49_1314 [Actinomycetota bacterium]|nr:hypothetical protein [Actinomycetota bacterium]
MDLAGFEELLTPEGARLLDELPPYEEAAALGVAAAARRRGLPDGLVAVAMTQQRLRARAVTKFGAAAGRMFFTPEGLEQATRPEVAARHARRFADAGLGRVADLCCGIGGELSALAGVGIEVLAIDRDPLTCAVAKANVAALGLGGVRVECADVVGTDLAEQQGAFIDPARRGGPGGRRTFDPSSFSPPYDVVLNLARDVGALGAKLAPGLPHHLIPPGVEAEWVSVDGAVVECALWFGPLASGVDRRATLLSGEGSVADLTGDGVDRAPVGPVHRYLYEPDGAVIRAGLVAEAAAQVGGTLVDSSIAYVTADGLVATPFLTAYEVTDVMPFGLKRLRTVLRDRGVGRLTVKKRGSAIEPESLRRQLRLDGPEEATVVLTRVAGEPTMLLVRRV